MSDLWFQGQATDIAIQAEEILKLKRQINNIYCKHTGQPLETIGTVFIKNVYSTSSLWLCDYCILHVTTLDMHSVYSALFLSPVDLYF